LTEATVPHSLEGSRRGGKIAHALMSPAEESALARKGHLAMCVKQVVDKAPLLTDDQLRKLRAILHPAPGGDR
jgi:hypothetical protein